MIKEELEKEAEQFLNSEGCPDCFCEDCTKDCRIKKLGLVEEENDQLTKAKELLKEFIFLLHNPRTALDTKTVMNKAEQFLKK